MKFRNLALLLAIVFIFSCKKKDPNDMTAPEGWHDRAVGASANELLSGNKYRSLKIEIQYMKGFSPDIPALTHFKNFLSTYLNKPDGIFIVTKEITSSDNTSFGLNDITTTDNQNRSVFSRGDQIALYILYTNGNYTDNSVLGMAYRNTSVVLFGKTIHDNSGGIGQSSRTKLEATVLEHEVGHLLGLVDTGSPMQSPHEDDAHDSHCANSDCLMYYAAETTDILGFLITGDIPSPDANCIADIHANGGK